MEKRYTPTGRARIETRADGKRMIVGYGAVFYDPDDEGTEYQLWGDTVERIAPGAFDRAIAEDDVRGLFNHDANRLLGRTAAGTMRLSVDAVGLRYEIDIDEDDADSASAARKIERGDLDGSSFSFRGERVTWIDGGDDGPEVRLLEAVELYDVGPVTFPAYQATTAGVRSGGETDEARAGYEQWKAESGRRKAEGLKKRARARLCELDLA